jgi:hypothetical protein
MGKSKKLRLKVNTTSPTGLQDLKKFNLDHEVSNSDRRLIIQKIETQLQEGAENQIHGLQALSTLCYNEVFIKSILNSDIVRITAPLVSF